jgi:RNA-directed DNA polymerase
MHGMKKSDLPIVPTKSANGAAQAAAESTEGRGGTKGNAGLQSTVRTQSRAAVSHAQKRIREAVNRNRKEKLTALLHHVTVDFLRAAFLGLKRRAAAGIDAVTWEQYAEGLEENLRDLHRRLRSGAYRALPARRTYIPKADGKQRPLGIAAMEDKIVQAAVVMLLTPIYEAEFLGFSYGFRPGRSQHDALDALAYGIKGRYIWWVLDADIRSFFDSISRKWLIRFVEHRIGESQNHSPDPEMAQRGCAGTGYVERNRDRYSARSGNLAAAREHLSALCVRSMGSGMAKAPGRRRHDRHSLCG